MSFTVRIRPSGHQMQVEGQETLLAAALRQGILLPYGCQNGFCGSCACQLEQGEVDYPNGLPEPLKTLGADACLSCQAVPRGDLVLRVHEPAGVEEFPVRILPCKVEQLEQLAHDVARLRLKLPEGQRLQFLAGQYLDILLADGRHRAFSIANAPHDDALIELHIRHVAGGEFTDFVFSSLQAKALLRIQAPMGRFTLREDSVRPLILVAGGTGFAPIKGMIEHGLHIGDRRPLHLYWGVRARRDLYLRELAEGWARAHDHIRFTPVLSEPDADWSGRHGWVHQAVLEDHPGLDGFDVYMAGPPPMISAARQAFTAAGLPADRLYSDAFEYAARAEGKP